MMTKLLLLITLGLFFSGTTHAELFERPVPRKKVAAPVVQRKAPAVVGRHWAPAYNHKAVIPHKVVAPHKVPVMTGELSYVLCETDPAKLQVLDDQLNNQFFVAMPYEKVIPFQSFHGAPTQYKQVDGHEVKYIKVKFDIVSDDDTSSGWIQADSMVQTAKCQGMPAAAPVANLPGVAPEAAMVAFTADAFEQQSDTCCLFPTSDHPTMSYIDGMRQFGFSRPRNRWHAACDLYRPRNEPVQAIADGTVLRVVAKFYDNTFVTEIQLDMNPADQPNVHPVIRYGEVTGQVPPGIKAGVHVKAGDIVGYVGKTSVPWPMLHFEIYAGTLQGPLSQLWEKSGFERRHDLVNPTEYLEAWEKKTFPDSVSSSPNLSDDSPDPE